MTSSVRKSGWLQRAGQFGRWVENGLLLGLLGAMMLLGGAQIVLRNLANGGLAWADEALRIMVLWLALLGAVAASRDHRHISIDVLSRVLPEVPARIAALVVNLFTSAICLTLAWFSFEFVLESREYGDRLLGDLPAWILQSIIPVAFFLIGYRYLIFAFERLAQLVQRNLSA
ncbi:MAG TPA: TRAP transporter small permease, partial [Chromatiales bacterium]|nr:TRAP transporter small permease [Chromatiales bacterium]